MTAAEFAITSGARAGRTIRFTKDFATVGRHPSSDLQFDPQADLDVSVRHAAVFRQGERWMVRDLGSTNGTYVNSQRVRHDHALTPGDVLRFGANGPQAIFAVLDETVLAAAMEETGAPQTAEHAAPEPARSAGRGGESGSVTAKVRQEVRRQTGWLRWALVAAVLVALVAGSTALWQYLGRGRALRAERDRLIAQVDSLARELGDAAGVTTTMQSELATAQATLLTLRTAIAAGGADQERLQAFDRELTRAVTEQGALLRAATMDAGSVSQANAGAVALVLAQLRDGRSYTATGFTARVHGDTGWIVTNRHAVQDSSGIPAQRIGVVYHGTGQNFRADLVAVHDTADIAVLRVVVRGGVPAVQGLAPNDTLTPGSPVALLSFPHGLELPMGGEWKRVGVSVSTLTGSVSRVLPDLIQLEGYGAEGSSGSPVFNARGEVVGIVFGGERGTGGRILYAAPVRDVLSLLPE